MPLTYTDGSSRDMRHGVEVESEKAEATQEQGQSPAARVHFQMGVLTQLPNLNKLTAPA